MSMNFLEGLGYVAQGAIEKDEQIRQEKLQSRMEEMKENRAFYREQAKTRYAVDLAEYQEESKKVKSIQAALANIKNSNGGKGMSKYDAALTLIKADEKEMAFFNALPDASKTPYVMQKTNTFEDILGEDGEVTGFKVNYSLPTLTSPQEADYRKGTEFWNDYAEEIRQGTDGPLTRQVKKLLGKEADASKVVSQDLNVKGTQVVGDFGTEEIISNNTSKSDLLSASTGDYAYSWTDKTDPEYISFNTVMDNYKNIRTDKNKASIVAAPILALDKGSLKDLTTTADGTVMADGDAQFLFGQTADLYNASNTFLRDNIIYADSSVPFLKKNTRAASIENHSKIFKSQWNARTITLDNDGLLAFGGTIDGKYVIGTDILPLMVDKDLNPIFYNDEVKSIIEQNVNEYISDKEGSISDHEKGINQVIKNTIAELEKQTKDNKSVYANDGTETNVQEDNTKETETETQTETTGFGKSGFVGEFRDMNNEQAYNYILEVAKENDNMPINEVIADFENNNQEVPAVIKWMAANKTETADEMGGINKWRAKHGYKPEGGFLLKYDFDPSTGLKKFVDPSLTAGHVKPRPKQGTIPQGEWDRIWSNTHNPDGTPKQIPADI
mgnify:FL=1